MVGSLAREWPVLLSTIETLWCVLVVLGGLMVFGLPVQWLLGGGQPLTEAGWARAPLLGLAAIVLPSQALVYADVPISYSAPALWATAAALFAWMWRRGGVPRRSAPRGLL